jgi:hypothetical protein
MNIMIISNSPEEMQDKLGRLNAKHPPNQNYVFKVRLTDWSAATPFFNYDTQTNPNMHLIIIADRIDRLWQGARRLLDIIIETDNGDVDEWLATLLSGDFPKQRVNPDSLDDPR